MYPDQLAKKPADLGLHFSKQVLRMIKMVLEPDKL